MAGIMAQIRQKLSEGISAKELINLGYRPGSVYKIQWQFRKRGVLVSQAHAVEPQTTGTTKDKEPETNEEWKHVADAQPIGEEVNHADQTEEMRRLRSDLAQLRSEFETLRPLEGQFSEMCVRIRNIEIGDEVGSLEQRIDDLETQLGTVAKLGEQVSLARSDVLTLLKFLKGVVLPTIERRLPDTPENAGLDLGGLMVVPDGYGPASQCGHYAAAGRVTCDNLECISDLIIARGSQ